MERNLNNTDIDSDKKSIIYSLEKKGVLDNLRAYLRSDIYNKLKNKDEEEVKLQSPSYNNFVSSQRVNSKFTDRSIDYEQTRLSKLTLSLIVDYLKKNNMNYSLSVFLPECKKIIGEELYTESDMSKLCDVSYENLTKSEETSFLGYFVKTTISRFSKFSEKRVISTQTQTEFDSKIENLSIEEKLKQIDTKYSQNITTESLMPAKAIEEKMIKFQREIESRYKSDLIRETTRIKEVEISIMRIEENKKYMKKLEEIREEYEKEYREQIESCKKREADFNTRMNIKEKELEVIVYENRQKFLNELQTLKFKEDDLKRKYENDFNNIKITEEKLKMNQKEIDHIRDSYNKKLAQEFEQFKFEYDGKFELEKNELRKRRLEVEETEIKLKLQGDKTNSLESKVTSLKEEKVKLSNDLKELEHKLSNMKKDNEALREEIKLHFETEKRNSELMVRREHETSHYREESKILRESLEEHKRLTEERKREHQIIVDNLKRQLEETFSRVDKIKSNNIETEHEIYRKNLTGLLEKERETNIERLKEFEKKNKNLEDNFKKLKIAYDNIYKRSNNYNQGGALEDLRISARNSNWTKLEKEAEELKNEFRRSFVHSTKRDLLENQRSSIANERIVYVPFNPVTNSNTNNIGSTTNNISIPNNIHVESYQNQNQLQNQQQVSNITSNPIINQTNNTPPISQIQSDIQFKNETHIRNDSADKTNKTSNTPIQEERELSISVSTPLNQKSIATVEEIPVNISPILIPEDSKTTSNKELRVLKKDNELIKSKEQEDKDKIYQELNKMKEDYKRVKDQKDKEKDKLPTPIIVGGTSTTEGVISPQNNILNHINSNRSKEFDKHDSEFSVAAINSSNEWEVDNIKKDPVKDDNKISKKKEEIKENLTTSNISISTSIKFKPIQNQIKEESDESYNISNLIDNSTNKEKKNSFITESLADYAKNSFNKFSNVNYELDKNEIEEDIKADESDNYDYDFVEDVEGLEKKMSVDLDAFKNASIGNLNKPPINPHNKSNRSQSMDRQIDKLLQSRASGTIEENIIEDISADNSKRENVNSHKSGTNEEDSALKYNDYYQSANVNMAVSSSNNNIIKNVRGNNDSSIKDSKLYESRTSDIKEVIIPDEEEDDAYIPINHNTDEF